MLYIWTRGLIKRFLQYNAHYYSASDSRWCKHKRNLLKRCWVAPRISRKILGSGVMYPGTVPQVPLCNRASDDTSALLTTWLPPPHMDPETWASALAASGTWIQLPTVPIHAVRSPLLPNTAPDGHSKTATGDSKWQSLYSVLMREAWGANTWRFRLLWWAGASDAGDQRMTNSTTALSVLLVRSHCSSVFSVKQNLSMVQDSVDVPLHLWNFLWLL